MTGRAPNINRSKEHDVLVQRLAMDKLPGADRSLFPTIRELLCFAALLGYSENRRVPLDRKAGVEDISYQQFERGDAQDLIWLLALADTQDPEVLKDGGEGRCAEVFEEYANGGLQVINDAILRDGGEYPDRALLEMLKRGGYLNTDDETHDLTDLTF